MANKKINQLVLKTTIQSTDLFPLGDATTGQLYKKTIAELQAAIGGAVISVNGLVGTVVLDTDDIQELASPTNKYFTDARARAAISLTTTGSSGASTYSSSTGVLNVPTYTLAGLGGITASFLSGGTGITYNSGTGVISYSGTVYTDSSIRALVSAGTGLSYNSTTGVFSYSGTIYTDSSVRALITGTAPISYNNTTGAISISQATTSTDGYLSSTDWNTFNGKQSALTLGNLTEATSSVLTITGGTGSVIGSGTSIQVKQASSTVSGFLSSTDWTTFNSKQGTITLTTTGTSGAATFSGGTLNIPQYQAVLTNPVTGTGTTNYVSKWTSSSAIGNSSIQDSGSLITIGNQIVSTVSSGIFLYNSSGGTNVIQARLNNTSGDMRIGIEGSTAGTMQTGTSAYAAVFGNQANNSTQLTTNGTVRMTITGAGATTFTGTVTAQSGFKLPANGNGTSPTIAYNNSLSFGVSGTGIFFGNLYNSDLSTAMQFRVTNGGGTDINAMTINSDGLIGVNTTSITQIGTNYGTIAIGGSVGGGIRMLSGTTTRGYVYADGTGMSLQAGASMPLIFFSNNTEQMRIASGGNILMGTTTDNGERLYVSGSIRATGSITANSDARLKKNIERIENALEKVGQISGYTYNTIYDEDRHAGVIAQEIDLVLPEIVNKGNDGLMGVEYGNISALLIEAIKDLKGQNESLKARLTALEK